MDTEPNVEHMIHLSFLLMLQAAPAPPFGVEFRAPPGWESVDARPLRAFAPVGLARGEGLLLTVWPVERVSANAFASWFQLKLAGPGETVLQESEIERRPINGLEVLTATQRVTLAQGGQVVRVVYGIGSGDRVAVAMLTSNQDQLITRFAGPARAFFESLRFSETAPPVASQPAPEGPAPGQRFTPIPLAGVDGNTLRGLFYRLQAGTGSRMETRTRIFLPSNRLLRLDPFGGGDMIDLGRCSPDTCGGYRIEEGWLTVRWDNGETQRLTFARSGEGFSLDGDTYQPARGLGPAEAVGTWVNPTGINTVLQLKGDGTFEWGTGSREGTLLGRYELQGLTLVLHFADGTNRGYTIFPGSRTRPAGLISLDGIVYSRR